MGVDGGAVRARDAAATEPEPAVDGLEVTLGQALRLLESAVDHHRRNALLGATAELPTGGERVIGWTARLLFRAEREVVWALPAVAGEEHARLVARTVSQLARKKVAVRMLCPAPLVRCAAWRRAVAVLGAELEVRVSGAVRQELILVDGETIIAPDSPLTASGGSGASVIQNSVVADMLQHLLGGVWDTARCPARPLPFEGGTRGRVLQEVLILMGEGYKDDAAARKLGLSVRTYRRYVADIMRDLQVDSRFQAGVRAARSGLMEPDAG